MTKAELQELEKIVAEASKNDIIVGAETGMIQNDGKYKEIIRVVVYHKPSKKHVVVMYRDNPSNFKKWLTESMDSFITTIHKQIARDAEKKTL